MKISRVIAFILIGLAVILTGFGGIMDLFGTGTRRCGCACPMCAGGRCAAALYGGPCPCPFRGAGASGLYISKAHVWNDALFLMLVAIVLLVAF